MLAVKLGGLRFLPRGPFAGAEEAHVASKGFVEDLESESAEGITLKIDRHCQPDLLTIEHDRTELLGA
jgi:predicted membrane GTPase involved in stress response